LPDGWERIPTVAKISVCGKTYNLDIRGDGGMIVCPGSLHADTGKAYTMVEPWTPELVALAPEFDPSWLDMEAPHKAAQYEPFTCDVPPNDRQQKAREILLKKPGAVAGRGADNYCYAVAIELVHGCCLTPDEALPVFMEWGTRLDHEDGSRPVRWRFRSPWRDGVPSVPYSNDSVLDGFIPSNTVRDERTTSLGQQSSVWYCIGGADDRR
jgi:hypothetical protein